MQSSYGQTVRTADKPDEGASVTAAFLQPRSDLLANSCLFFFPWHFLQWGVTYFTWYFFIFYVSANLM